MERSKNLPVGGGVSEGIELRKLKNSVLEFLKASGVRTNVHPYSCFIE